MEGPRALLDLPATWLRRAGREFAPRVKEFRRAAHAFRKSAIAMAGLVLIGAFVVIAAFAPALAPPLASSDDPFEMPTNESEAWCPPAQADGESWSWIVAPAAGALRGADFDLFLPPVSEDVVGRYAWFNVEVILSNGRPAPSEAVSWTVDGSPAGQGFAYRLPLDEPGERLVRAQVSAVGLEASYAWRVHVPEERATHLIVLSPRTALRLTPTSETVSLQVLQIRICNSALISQGEDLKAVPWTVNGSPAGSRSALAVPLDQDAAVVQASYSRPTYPFGQTESGKDVFYGVIWGSRISMRIGLEVVGVAIIVGAILGLLAGYYGRLVDEALMRVTDVFFGLPSLILAMVVIVSLGPTLDNLVIALVIVAWPGYARLIRGVTLSVKNNLYVEAGRAGGARTGAILRKHVFPNTVSPLMVQASLDIGGIVLTAAGLSFIGFSFVTPNTAEWGRLIYVGQQQLGASTGQVWWPVLYPGAFIFLYVLGFNMLGDGLRDVLDPRLRR
ncbi:MAG TPA: ABC transporter permease [Candidatus Thermoplasmatota archaeon]|nr:ABC transporter permease [Candidatus Thermoplasmatota archaeon]